MAVIDQGTLNSRAVTLFYRVNQRGVPVLLPFRIVTIDSDFQAYEPGWVGTSIDTGSMQFGVATDAVYLTSNTPLPLPPQVAVWAYYGI